MADLRMMSSSRVASRSVAAAAPAPVALAACRRVVASAPAACKSLNQQPQRQHQQQRVVCSAYAEFTENQSPPRTQEDDLSDVETFPYTPYNPARMNRIDLVGTVGPDALALEPTDTPHLRFWLRVDVKKKTGPDNCTWYSVELWGDMATAAVEHLAPNQLLFVSGNLRAEEFRQEDGTKKVYLYVEAETINKVIDDGSAIRPVNIYTPSYQQQRPQEGQGSYGQQQRSFGADGERPVRARPTPQEIEQRWQDVFANPDAYFDNRANKRNPRAPDFKHKENQDLVLWLNSDYNPPPAWVLERLPELDARRGSQPQQYQQQQERPRRDPADVEATWNELFANPETFYDNRLSKPSDRAPDFVRRDNRNVALWINPDTPAWVQSKLAQLPPPPPPRQQQQGFASDQGGAGAGGPPVDQATMEQRWQDLFNNWNQYWDNRTTKRNPRGPDFKHKDNPERALWLDSPRNPTPQWVYEKLKQIDSKSQSFAR